jgi:hypothetical protein
MASRGFPGVLGMIGGAVLAAALIPITVAGPARADCYGTELDPCDPGATVTTTGTLFDPSGSDTSIVNMGDDFSADIFNNGAGTVNEFFFNSDPDLDLGVPGAIEDIFTSPWGDFSFVIPDGLPSLMSG